MDHTIIRIGVLIVDDLPAELADIDGDYDALYRALLAAPDIEVDSWRAHHGELPESVDRCDAWLVGGSSASVYDDDPWIAQLGEFVVAAHERGVCLVGICFGHQLFAHVLGGETGPAPVGWNVGAIVYRRADGSEFALLASHRDQVLALPEDAKLTLSAARCPIAGFRIGTSVWSMQPHPEFSAELGAAIYERRRRVLGDAVADVAIASTAAPLARNELAAELVAFVRANRASSPSQ